MSASQCSLSGEAGGLAARAVDSIGCCNNRCTEKVKDYFGNYYCPGEGKVTKGLGAECVLDNECGKDGVAGALGVSYFDSVGCCGGFCRRKINGLCPLSQPDEEGYHQPPITGGATHYPEISIRHGPGIPGISLNPNYF